MDTPVTLPDGFTARPCVASDVRAVFEMVAACEAVDAGEVGIELDDIDSEWAKPSFDLATDTVAVFEDATGSLVAQGEITYGTRADACVHPGWRGRGIGTWLLRWTEDRARARGASRIGQTVVDTATDATELFERHGYTWLWTSWILQIRFTDAPPNAPELPDGYAIRDFVQGADDRAVHAVVDRAFLEWSDRDPEPFEDWEAKTVARAGFEPWLLPLVTAPDGTIVGVVFLIDSQDQVDGWVQQLAVAKKHRGRGLGRALLDEAFNRFYARGRRVCELNTDSRTGALGLYEHVGMSVKSSYTHRALQFADTD
jgi:GNAT superfamily N-acetyltransferase